MKKKEEKKLSDIPKLHSKERGSPFYEENRVEGDLIDDSKYLKWCYRAIDLFKQGMTKQAIASQIESECKGKIPLTNIHDVVISRARQIISLEYQKNDKFVISLHLQRYKKEVESLREKIKRTESKTKIDPHTRQQIINSYYYDILDLMFHQEKLLQLHNKKVVVKINQINNTFIKKKISKFDLSLLNFQERKELLSLLLKSKRTDSEIYGVIISDKKEKKEIEEAEVIEEITNVENIQLVEKKEIEELQPGLGLLTTFEKLKKTFEEKAKQEFKRVGGKVE